MHLFLVARVEVWKKYERNRRGKTTISSDKNTLRYRGRMKCALDIWIYSPHQDILH